MQPSWSNSNRLDLPYTYLRNVYSTSRTSTTSANNNGRPTSAVIVRRALVLETAVAL